MSNAPLAIPELVQHALRDWISVQWKYEGEIITGWRTLQLWQDSIESENEIVTTWWQECSRNNVRLFLGDEERTAWVGYHQHPVYAVVGVNAPIVARLTEAGDFTTPGGSKALLYECLDRIFAVTPFELTVSHWGHLVARFLSVLSEPCIHAITPWVLRASSGAYEDMASTSVKNGWTENTRLVGYEQQLAAYLRHSARFELWFNEY